jgi:hypothetical protein
LPFFSELHFIRLDFCGFQWVEPMADAGADQYTFHLEATSDDEVEGLCRKVREFYTIDSSFLLVADFGCRIPIFRGLPDPAPAPDPSLFS